MIAQSSDRIAVMSRILTPHTINGITQDMAIQSNHKKFLQSNRLISMLF